LFFQPEADHPGEHPAHRAGYQEQPSFPLMQDDFPIK
jgi:hypothetical protein